MAENQRLRTNKMQIWLLDEEKAMLEKSAFELSLSKSDFLRSLIMGGSVIGQHPVIEKEQGAKLLYEVNRIGNNINQLTYNSNAKSFATINDWKEVRRECVEILALLGELVDMDKELMDEWRLRIYTQLRKP